MDINYEQQKPSAPPIQPLYSLEYRTESDDFSGLSTSNKIADLKKWIVISIVSNIIISIEIIGLLIFMYYTFLIETQ